MAGWQDAPIVGGGSWRDAPIVSDEPKRNVVATTDDGGAVYKMDDGTLSFASPGYATSDQAIIAKIMEGATPADIGQSQIDNQRIDQNPIMARALKAQEGIPFIGSYTDEIVGAIDPARGENLRRASESMAREKPGQSVALGVGGAFVGAVPVALAAGPALLSGAGTTLGGQALRGAAVGAGIGATEGAIHGAGRSEGEGRAANATQGGIFGGIAGGVLGAAAPYAAEGIKLGLTKWRGSDVGVIANQLKISTPAARVVKNALDAGDIVEAEKALTRAGPGAMLADAGQPARELLDASAATGGAAGRIAKDAVDERVTGASKEVTAALDTYLGKPVGRASMARGVREGTATARQTAYDAAYSKAIDYSLPRGAALEGMFSRVPESAINDANALMRAEGVESAQIIAKIADDGKVTLESLPDVRQLDYITRALQGVADKADGAGKLGGSTPLGNAYSKLSRDIRNMVKGEVPEYAHALDVASDAIRTVKAGEIGYSMLRPGTTREAVTDALRGSGKSEREAMKRGVRSYIDDTMANVTKALTDPNVDARETLKVLRDMSSRANSQKLRFLLGKEASATFFEKIDTATVAFELRAALAMNSKTAIRQSIQGGVKQQTAPGMLETVASGEPINAAKRFVQIFTGSTDEAQALREAGIFEEIATALTQTRGFQAKTSLTLVQKAMAGQKLSEQQASFIGRTVAESGFLAGSREGTRLQTTQ
jgi:hypothetical protein